MKLFPHLCKEPWYIYNYSKALDEASCCSWTCAWALKPPWITSVSLGFLLHLETPASPDLCSLPLTHKCKQTAWWVYTNWGTDTYNLYATSTHSPQAQILHWRLYIKGSECVQCTKQKKFTKCKTRNTRKTLLSTTIFIQLFQALRLTLKHIKPAFYFVQDGFFDNLCSLLNQCLILCSKIFSFKPLPYISQHLILT